MAGCHGSSSAGSDDLRPDLGDTQKELWISLRTLVLWMVLEVRRDSLEPRGGGLVATLGDGIGDDHGR